MAIEEAGLKPDIISGVSAGSVIAVLYGAGLKPADMLKVFADPAFSKYARFKIAKGGLFSPDRFVKVILKAIAPMKRLEDLRMPVHLGVTDFDNVRPAEFHTGEIGPRMIASCSIPIVFPPVEIDGVHYVDGGLLRNHPAWIIRDKCDFLIGVNCSPMPQSNTAPDSLMQVALRTYHIMLKSNQNADMAMCDISVSPPELSYYKIFNLKNITTVFNSGYIHMRAALRKAGLWHPTDTTDSEPESTLNS